MLEQLLQSRPEWYPIFDKIGSQDEHYQDSRRAGKRI